MKAALRAMKRRTSRKPSARRLMRRPLRDVGELAMLETVLERKGRRFRRLRWILLGIGAFTLFMNLVGALEEAGGSPDDRFFSLIVIALFAVLLTPGTVRTAWTYPRLLAAQRRLLRDRGLLHELSPGALAEDVERLAAALRPRLAAAGGAVATLDRAVAAARRHAEALRRAPAGEPGREAGGARLEAFLFRLAEVEVEGLLESGFYRDRAGDAIDRAASCLEASPLAGP